MATGEDAISGVRRWIEESGFPLQMTTVHEVSKAGPTTVEHGGYYLDPNGETWREFDVVAEWSGDFARSDINIKACIECKSGTAPWVMFTDDAASVSSDHSGNVIENSILAKSSGVVDVDVRAFYRKVMNSALQELHLDGDIGAFVKAAHSRDDEPYAAIRQAVSTARGIADEDVLTYAGSGKSVITLAIPIVVTKSRLYRCSLNTILGDWSVEECTAVSVRAPRDNFAPGISPTVRLVHESALSELSATLEGATWAVRSDT